MRYLLFILVFFILIMIGLFVFFIKPILWILASGVIALIVVSDFST
jgi:hypothetical protein